MALNGALAGLVAITAGCDVIGPLESLVVGSFAGFVVVEGVMLLERLRIDDPVGAIPVHLFCGVFGTVVVGLFANSADLKGLFHGGGFGLLTTQLLGAVSGGGLAFVVGGAVWLSLSRLPGGVRVERDHEVEGLDLSECGVSAYSADLPARAPNERPLGRRSAAVSPR
jgi:Amt family ammonium transporter